MKNKRFICFGGGNAMPKVVLAELKCHDVDIVSVTSMADNGGSTGQLRSQLGVLPPGDIRRHILALSDAPLWKKKLWSFRFGNEEFAGGHKGHNFGNIFLAGLENILGGYDEVLNKSCDFMEVRKNFKIMPATTGNVTICAELEDGMIIEGETEIDVPMNHDDDKKIKKLFLKNKVRGHAALIKEILKADVIVLGPGDLYSSIIPCFLPSGISSAIKKSKAKKIFVCNIMNKRGETGGFIVENFSEEIEKYIGTKLDFVLYNNKILEKELIKDFTKNDKSLLDQVEFKKDYEKDKFIGCNLIKNKTLDHSGKKLVKKILDLVD